LTHIDFMLKRKSIQSYFMFLNIFRLFSYNNIVNSFYWCISLYIFSWSESFY